MAALPFVLKEIPIAGLAGVLVYTGYRIVNVAASPPDRPSIRVPTRIRLVLNFI